MCTYRKYTGLNLGMQAYDNMRKPVTVMHQANILKKKKKQIIISYSWHRILRTFQRNQQSFKKKEKKKKERNDSWQTRNRGIILFHTACL